MEKKLWLIWKQPETRKRYFVGILENINSKFIFKYKNPDIEEAKIDKFDFFPGFENLEETYESSELFPNILTRLPNKTRPDYLEILNDYCLEDSASDWDILKRTKGRLFTDSYEFVPAFEEKEEIDFDVAGTRYSECVNKCKVENILRINDDLKLELDSTNKMDPYAIKVIHINSSLCQELGYVPRYYSKEMSELLKKGVKYSAKIQSLRLDTPLNDEDISVKVKLLFEI